MKIENEYLILNDVYLKNKKITGTTFVGLAGLDNFKKKGDTVLSIFGIYKEVIDPYWLKRGDIAESIVKRVYERDGFKTETFTKREINFDNFPENKNYGGMFDINLPLRGAIIEVKSKSMKDYDNIKQWGVKKEEYQGLYYAYMKGYDEAIMEWIFFDEETEANIKADLPYTFKNLKRHTKSLLVNKDEMEQLFYETWAYKDKCYNEKRILLNDISEKVLISIGVLK